jgi:FkbM family methyltransferase
VTRPRIGFSSFQKAAGEGAFRLVKIYCRLVPFRKGKARLFVTLCELTRYRPPQSIVKSTDGRRLTVDLAWGGMDEIYFLGEYERSVTAAIAAVTRPGDFCIDVGANIGWYSTLMGSLACRTPADRTQQGHVLAIEPSTPTRIVLERNLALSANRTSVTVAKVALGSAAGVANLSTFPGSPMGHASLSDQGHVCPMNEIVQVLPLNALLQTNASTIGREVDIIKVDVEGSEFEFLKGATDLFSQADPPILIMEMALATSKHFGYGPQALIDFVQSHATYEFFALDPASISMQRIDRFPEGHIGANVVAFPADRRRAQFSQLLSKVPLVPGTFGS